MGSTALAGFSLSGLGAQGKRRASASNGASVEAGYLTHDKDFKTVGRGKPPPSEMPEQQRREVGLTPAVLGFSARTAKPEQWPLRDSVVPWRAALSGLAPGRYDLRCRTLDTNGAAQPMPRPLLKSGRNLIQSVSLVIES